LGFLLDQRVDFLLVGSELLLGPGKLLRRSLRLKGRSLLVGLFDRGVVGRGRGF
jgi:hypothetical protein